MNFLKKIKFRRKTSTSKPKDTIEFFGEITEEGLNNYSTYTEIKEAIIKEIVNRLEDDIQLKVEALKPEIAEEIIKKNSKH